MKPGFNFMGEPTLRVRDYHTYEGNPFAGEWCRCCGLPEGWHPSRAQVKLRQIGESLDQRHRRGKEARERVS